MLKSPYTSTLERQFVEPNVVDEKDVQNNQSKEPLAKLPTGKFCKPISAPEKPFF